MNTLVAVIQLLATAASAALNGLFFGAGFAVAAMFIEKKLKM